MARVPAQFGGDDDGGVEAPTPINASAGIEWTPPDACDLSGVGVDLEVDEVA